MNYRKIWEKHFNACLLPWVQIHHADGDHDNNSIKNLIPVTVQEHYDIHYSNGDYFACFLLSSQHLNLSTEERSNLSKKCAESQLENGSHPFQDKKLQLANKIRQQELWNNSTHPFQTKEATSKLEVKRQEMIKNNTHTFTNPKIREKQVAGVKRAASEGRLYSQTNKLKMSQDNSCRQKQRAESGTLNLLDPELRKRTSDRMKKTVSEQIKNGTHHSQVTHVCSKCGKIGKGAAMKRYHFDRCRTPNSDLILSR
jgi:hypothetical protein